MSQTDYLFKKVAANKVKTDSTATPISATNESYYTSNLVQSNNVWLQSRLLSGGPAGSGAPVVQLRTAVKMTSVHGVGVSQDFPLLIGFSWNSGTTDWIDPSYNLLYSPTFYVGPTGSSPGSADVYTIASTPEFPFIFDYKSGILTFLSAVPTAPYNLAFLTLGTPGTPNAFQTTYALWITGYTYKGL